MSTIVEQAFEKAVERDFWESFFQKKKQGALSILVEKVQKKKIWEEVVECEAKNSQQQDDMENPFLPF